MLCSSGGSFLMNSNQPCVGIPKLTAVNALLMAMSIDSEGAPSIRRNAFSKPDSSTMAMTIGTPISPALAAAASISRSLADWVIDSRVMVLLIFSVPFLSCMHKVQKISVIGPIGWIEKHYCIQPCECLCVRNAKSPLRDSGNLGEG